MFEQLAVDPHVRRAIDDAVQQNRLPHALILEGSDDETRLAAAREIAMALLDTTILSRQPNEPDPSGFLPLSAGDPVFL